MAKPTNSSHGRWPAWVVSHPRIPAPSVSWVTATTLGHHLAHAPPPVPDDGLLLSNPPPVMHPHSPHHPMCTARNTPPLNVVAVEAFLRAMEKVPLPVAARTTHVACNTLLPAEVRGTSPQPLDSE